MRSTARARAAALSVVWAFVLCFLVAPASRAAPTFPALSGRVVDDAHILTPEIQADLTQKLAALETSNSRQLIVVTVPSLQGYDIADYGYQLGRAWGVGQKTTNNGALFLIAPNERKVRIEVGYGLEGVLTDAMSNLILQRAVLPKFRAGDMPGGVVAGTQALIEQLSLEPSVAEQRAAEAAAQQHTGSKARSGSPFGLLMVILVIVFVLRSVMTGRGGGFLGGFLPGMILGSLMGGGRRDNDWGGGGGFGGGGGGGFGGGGGGSFGGGGSSGSW